MTTDRFGFPKRGATIRLNKNNYALYERPIRVYENNKLELRNGNIYINGKQTDTYIQDGLLLDDGRQPRPLRRFAFLGIRSRRPHSGQAAHGVDFARQGLRFV